MHSPDRWFDGLCGTWLPVLVGWATRLGASDPELVAQRVLLAAVPCLAHDEDARARHLGQARGHGPVRVLGPPAIDDDDPDPRAAHRHDPWYAP